MILPKNMNEKAKPFVYTLLCALHGLFYGTLYAPSQALIFGLSFKGMIAWIVAGLWFDVIHAVGNIGASLLITPLISVLKRCEKSREY